MYAKIVKQTIIIVIIIKTLRTGVKYSATPRAVPLTELKTLCILSFTFAPSLIESLLLYFLFCYVCHCLFI